MEEKKIYHEIPGGRNKFHSAILTTYSFNFHHFEYQTLKTLKQKWIINVGVLVDANKLDEVLGISSGGLMQMTKSYSINGIQSRAAFHPKMNFFIGDKQLLLILGSGNLTPGGQGKNHETFGVLYADQKDSKLIPALAEAYEYIKQIGADLGGFSARRINKSIPGNCEFLNKPSNQKHVFYPIDDELELALIYNDSTSIYKQIIDLIPASSIQKIRILSPYYDKNGALLSRFLESFPNAIIEVYLPENNGLPPTEFIGNKRVSFYKWEDTRRAKKEIQSPENFDRKLHSKLFLFETSEQSYFLLGSANATIAAFGTESSRGINDEFNVLYKSKKRDFFKDLGIHGKKTIVEPSNLKRDSVIIESAPTKNNSPTRSAIITSCDLDNITLKVTLRIKHQPLFPYLCLYDDMGNSLYRVKSEVSENCNIVLTSDLIKKNIAFVRIEDEDGRALSNKQVVNSIDRLFETDPSKENRTIRGVRNALEIGRINEFELMDYLNIIRNDEKATFQNSSITAAVKLKDQDVSATMTYGEAMEASKKKSLESKLMMQHSSVQFWQSINTVFKQRHETVQNTLIDEEEDGDAERSNIRLSEDDENGRTVNIKKKEDADRILTQTDNLSKNYIKAIHLTSRDPKLELNEIVFCQFLLVGHVLTAIHHYNKYELPKDKNGRYRKYTPMQWDSTLKSCYSDLMKNVMIGFAKLCLTHKVVDSTDDSYRQTKLDDYKEEVSIFMLLFHHLVNKYSNETPRIESTDLACLTVFKLLGFPTEKSIHKLELISKSESEELFNMARIKRLLRRLKRINERTDIEDGYFFHPNCGVCKIYQKTNSNIKFKSIIDNGHFRETSPSAIKEFKINSRPK